MTTVLLISDNSGIGVVNGFSTIIQQQKQQPTVYKYRNRNRIITNPKTTVVTTTTKTVLGVTTVPQRDEIPLQTKPKTTVATTFGRPITNEMKEWNTNFVRTMKGYLFDTLYGDSNDSTTSIVSTDSTTRSSSSSSTMDRAYARFYALETIARMPYFSYVSVLHLYETIGLWRQHKLLKLHFCQSYNELHHLLIMEELGGNNRWIDRFIAQHIAFAYYWIVVAVYLVNPVIAYNLNQIVEEEAYETYNKFIQQNENTLKNMPPSQIAIQYYTSDDTVYMYDNMKHQQHDTTSTTTTSTDTIPSTTDTIPSTTDTIPSIQTDQLQQQQQRPQINTMYDVFCAIRDDELEHAETMKFYQQ